MLEAKVERRTDDRRTDRGDAGVTSGGPPGTARSRGSARAEVRWFLPGEIGTSLHPAGEGRSRTDLYHLASLTPGVAWKRRGGAAGAELKVRDAPVRAIRVEGVGGILERWRKLRVAAAPTEQDRWLPVHKRLWEQPGIQIAEVRIGDTVWTTLAVAIDLADPRGVRTLVRRCRDDLRAHAVAASYPTWLLSHDRLDRFTVPHAVA